MVDVNNKDYVVIVQCHIVKQRCSGYNCERAFNERVGGFSAYTRNVRRSLYMTCGGCCGRAVHRKLGNLIRRIKKQEGITRDRIVVQLASCMTRDNYHSSPCPHLDYIRGLIARLKLDVCEDTFVNETSEKRRKEGIYAVSGS